MFTLLLLSLAAEPEPLKNLNGPYEPSEAVRHLFVPPGFKVTPVAYEPAIIDPVCLCFDARGRIYVCEMPGYPNGGRAIGDESRGRIKLLEDRDGDGFFESVTTFATGLRFPTGITPYKDGVIVCNAPDLIYLKDTDGDNIADVNEVWYTGFDLANIQQLPNSLQWGPEHRIWGMVAGTGGTITCPKKPAMKPVNLRGKAFRFDPAEPASFEATSGGGQYGLCRDAAGTWFTCTNSQVCRQIVLPESLVRHNPDYVPPAVTADIDVEGTSIKLYRKSPFETWRVERTTRRRDGEDARRFPATELVPGGFSSSTCGCIIYDADLFPLSYRGSFFACDPGNNLILRRTLTPRGLVFQSTRPPEEPDREFLASDDNWFRPVHLTLGLDGAIYVCDFYREIIETPLSIPDDMKPRLNVESRARGRIWRIAPDKWTPTQPLDFAGDLKRTDREYRNHANQSVRTTARRILREQSSMPIPRGEADRLRFIPDPRISQDSLLGIDTGSTESRFTMEWATNRLSAQSDPWTVTLILCVMKTDQLTDLLTQRASGLPIPFISQATRLIGQKNQIQAVSTILAAVADGRLDAVALKGLAAGMPSAGLRKLLAQPPAELSATVDKLRSRFQEAAQRTDAPSLRLLAFAPFDVAKPALLNVLSPASPVELQIVAVQSLGQNSDPSIPSLLLERWGRLSPEVRREIQAVLLDRPERTRTLLAALESGTIKPGELDPARIQQLRNHPRPEIKALAVKVLASAIPADRKKVIAEYASVAGITGDAGRGKILFQSQCASCHQLGGLGHDVGPNLRATVPGKSNADLLTSILDPNREVDTRYLGYTATLADGRVLTGIIASESANGLTLRRADGAVDTILRADLESLRASGQSLMPEGLEKQIPPAGMADLLAYLREATNAP